MSIVSLVGGGILVTDTLRGVQLLWHARSDLRRVDAQLNINGGLAGSQSLMARPHPAQDGEDEGCESDQRSQATIDDGEVTGIVVDRDWDRLGIGSSWIHDWVVLAGSLAA